MGERLRSAPSDVCVVVDDQRVVLGVLRGASLARVSDEAEHTVEEDMELGPKTFRPSAGPDEIRAYLERHQVDSVLVTDPDGHLVGLLERSKVESADARRGAK